MRSFFFLILFGLPVFVKAQASVRPQNLQCEYLVDPEGIDEPLPRLSWNLSAIRPDKFNQRQTAYHIVVTYTNNNKDIVWNTGWVNSSENQHIVYAGKQLESDRSYSWKVCVKDETGAISVWSAAHWGTGLFKRAEWTAKWIGATEVYDPKQADCNVSDPWFRKTVEIKDRPKRAIMFIASVGYHELYINGNKIGNDVLAPCTTDLSKRARYVAYDITGELKPGKNEIAVWLGASWSIFSSYATDDKPRAPIVIAQADIYDTDNPAAAPTLRIQTDDSWKTHPSPNKLLGNWSFGHMGGEIWDANQEMPNWNQLNCDETTWVQATLYIPRLMLTAQMVEPNRLFGEINAIGIEKQADGSYRVDMGVNFAGWTEIKLKGEPGKRIDMIFSEREKQEVTFDIHNAFILDKTGEGTFHNHFNYSSGRWITIRGLTKAPKLSDIHGWNIHTNYQSGSSFSCSDSLQNWIYDKVRWNFENLTIGGYVVDCSSRERLGYGDADAFAETGMFNYRLGALYSKWMDDWRDVQGARGMDPLNYGGNADDGILPHTAPTYQGGGGPGWGGMCIMYPWLVYQHEGDKRILEKNFFMMKRWLAFLDSHTQKDNLMTRFGGQWDFLGDWLWPNANAEGMNNDKPQNICFNNCYRVYNLRTAAKIARLLGRAEEAGEWEQKAEASAKAIQQKYYNPADHSYSDASMGNMAAALFAQIPPPQLRDSVMKRLEKEILVVRKGHIHVGITAGAILFKVLRDAGRDDLIYSMTSQTDYPGWGYMRANGATSLWEMWEKNLAGHSLMHSSFLYPGAWYIDGVAGIKQNPEHPGFNNFIIRPPNLKESQLSWAKAEFNSSEGVIKSSWARKNGHLSMQVTVPPNTSAVLYFPSARADDIKVSSQFAVKKGLKNGYAVYALTAGTYKFADKDNL